MDKNTVLFGPIVCSRTEFLRDEKIISLYIQLTFLKTANVYKSRGTMTNDQKRGVSSA